MTAPSYAERIAEISGADIKTVRKVFDASYTKELLFHRVDLGYLERVDKFGVQAIGPDRKSDGSSWWARGSSLFFDPHYEHPVVNGVVYDIEGLGTLFFDEAGIREPNAPSDRKRVALVVTDRGLLNTYSVSVIEEDVKNPDAEIAIWGAVPRQAIDLIDISVDVSEYQEPREAGKRMERELLNALNFAAQMPLEMERGRIIRRTEIGLYAVERPVKA